MEQITLIIRAWLNGDYGDPELVVQLKVIMLLFPFVAAYVLIEWLRRNKQG